MKKLILALSLMALFIVACGEKKNQTQSKENLELQKQVETMDSTTKEFEIIKQDIDESSENLDELLKDL